MHIERVEETEISQEHLFANSCDSKLNKRGKLLKRTDIFINEDYCKDAIGYIR